MFCVLLGLRLNKGCSNSPFEIFIVESGGRKVTAEISKPISEFSKIVYKLFLKIKYFVNVPIESLQILYISKFFGL